MLRTLRTYFGNAGNAENLRQYKSRFSLIVEQILAFPGALTGLEKLSKKL